MFYTMYDAVKDDDSDSLVRFSVVGKERVQQQCARNPPSYRLKQLTVVFTNVKLLYVNLGCVK